MKVKTVGSLKPGSDTYRNPSQGAIQLSVAMMDRDVVDAVWWTRVRRDKVPGTQDIGWCRKRSGVRDGQSEGWLDHHQSNQ